MVGGCLGLINYDNPVQKLGRISIYNDPTTQKTSNGKCLSRTDLDESLVKLGISYSCIPSMAKRSRPLLSNDYQQFTGKLLSAVATVGMKTTCLDQELNQNSATCMCSDCHCMFGGLNFKLRFC